MITPEIRKTVQKILDFYSRGRNEEHDFLTLNPHFVNEQCAKIILAVSVDFLREGAAPASKVLAIVAHNIYQTINMPDEATEALYHISQISLQMHDYGDAERYSRLAMAHYQGTGNLAYQLDAILNISAAIGYNEEKSVRDQVAFLEEHLALYQSCPELHQTGAVYRTIGRSYAELNEASKAASYLIQADKVLKQQHGPAAALARVLTIYDYGELLADSTEGRFENRLMPPQDSYQHLNRLAPLLEDALDLSAQMGLEILVVEIMKILGKVLAAKGEPLRAIHIWQSAVAAANKIDQEKQLRILAQANMHIKWNKPDFLHRALIRIIQTACNHQYNRVLEESTKEIQYLAEGQDRPDWAFFAYMNIAGYYQWVQDGGDRWDQYFRMAKGLVKDLPTELQQEWHLLYEAEESSWTDRLGAEDSRLIAAQFRSKGNNTVAMGILRSALKKDRKVGNIIGVMKSLNLLLLCYLDQGMQKEAHATLVELMDIVIFEDELDPKDISGCFPSDMFRDDISLSDYLFGTFLPPLDRQLLIIRRINEVTPSLIEQLLEKRSITITRGRIARAIRTGGTLEDATSPMSFSDPSASANSYSALLALSLLEAQGRSPAHADIYKAAARMSIAGQRRLAGKDNCFEATFSKNLSLIINLYFQEFSSQPLQSPHWIHSTLLTAQYFIVTYYPTCEFRSKVADLVYDRFDLVDRRIVDLSNLQRYEEAMNLLDQQIHDLESRKERFTLGKRLVKLDLLRLTDNLDSAIAYGEALYSELFESGSIHEKLLVCSNLASAYFAIRDYAKAEDYSNEMMFYAELAEDAGDVMRAQRKLAWIFAHTGRLNNAVQLADKLLANAESLGDDKEERVAMADTVSELAFLMIRGKTTVQALDDKSDDSLLDRAAKFQKDALAIHQEHGLSHSVGLDYTFLAQIEMLRDLRLATKYAQLAVTTLEELPASRDKFRKRGAALFTHAQILFRIAQQHLPYKIHELTKIRNLLLRSVSDVLRVQRELSNEFDQMKYSRERMEFYDLLIDVLTLEMNVGYERNSKEKTEQLTWRLYAAVQMKKASIFNQKLDLLCKDVFAHELTRKESEISAKVADLEEKFKTKTYAPGNQITDESQARKDLTLANQELYRIRKELSIRKVSGGVNSTYLDQMADKIKNLTRHAPSYNYIDFHISPHFKSLSFFIRDGRIRCSLIDFNALSSSIDGYMPFLKNPLISNTEEVCGIGQALFGILVMPYVPWIRFGGRLILLSDRILHQLPFEALQTGRSTPHESHYLAQENITISYGISIMSLVQASQATDDQTPFPNTFAGFARSRFDGFRPHDWNNPLSDLDFTAEEVEQCSSHFEEPGIFLNERCNIEELKRVISEGVDILHIASHALIDSRHGVSLVFGASRDSGESSELLRYKDLYAFSGKLNTVVLSACHTGAGLAEGSEGVIGFVRGFRFIGASLIVSTLWSIDDRSTSLFMQQFYRNILAGRSAPIALREARLALLDHSYGSQPRSIRGVKTDQVDVSLGYRHPFHWAGFVLHDEAPPQAT